MADGAVLHHAPVRSTTSRRYRVIVTALVAISLVFGALLLFYDIPGSFSFAVKRRSITLIAITTVAIAAGVSTVVFHTITENRILTPSLLGLESMLALVQTLLVVLLGAAGLSIFVGVGNFVVKVGLMALFAAGLLMLLLRRGRALQGFLLIGVVLGIFFRSLTVFMQQILSPNEFNLIQAAQFGSLTSVSLQALPWALGATVLLSGIVWSRRRTLDVMALGRDIAVNVGVRYRANVYVSLAIVAALVAVSVALVGPMLFFGFLIAAVAYQLSDQDDHAHNLVMVILVGLATLTVGQFILSEFFTRTALTVVLDLIGGSTFLVVLLRRGALS